MIPPSALRAFPVADVSPDDLADALWLWFHLGGPTAPQPAAIVEPPKPEAPAPRPAAQAGSPDDSRPEVGAAPADGPSPASQDRRDLYTGGGAAGAGPASRAVRIPGASALAGRAGILKALRTSVRRTPAARPEIDATATAVRVAAEGLWLPVYRSARAPWLAVALVVDGGPTMGPWRDVARDLHRVLLQSRVFRDVRAWMLTTDRGGSFRLQSGLDRGRHGVDHHPDELSDPAAQRLTLVLSDCVDAGWNDGRAPAQLARWGRCGPIAVLQVLPEQLWPRTSLGAATVLDVRSPRPFMPALDLQRIADPLADELPATSAIPVPVAPLDPPALRAMLRMLAGLPSAGYPARVWEGTMAVSEPGVVSAAGIATASTDDDEALRRFWRTSSPLARRLAMLLSVCDPITLPIVRLVRGSMLPSATQLHEAELLCGGLLEVSDHAERLASAPDEVHYDYAPGVRPRLLERIDRPTAFEVLSGVSDFLRGEGADGFDFRAALRDPEGVEAGAGVDGSPFARLAVDVLRRFGINISARPSTPAPVTPPQPQNAADEPAVEWSFGVWEAFNWANALASASTTPVAAIDVGLLLSGVILDGDSYRDQDVTSARFVKALGGDALAILGRVALPLRADGLRLSLDPSVRALMSEAARVAVASVDHAIHVRHVLAAALFGRGPELDVARRFIASLGDVEALSEQFRSWFDDASEDGDRLDDWMRLLDGGHARVESAGRRERQPVDVGTRPPSAQATKRNGTAQMPLDWTVDERRELLDVLAKLYPSVDDATRLLSRMAVPVGHLDMRSDAVAFWSRALAELDKRGLDPLPLFELATGEHTHDPTLRALRGRLEARASLSAFTAPGSAELPGGLERVLNATNPPLDLPRFIGLLNVVREQVCLVEVSGQPVGTGFLVGPSAVITCYHNLTKAIEGKVAAAEITVRFDYRDGAHGTSFSLHDDWKIDASPYAKFEPYNSDQGLPAPEELNYVVVRLAGDVGAPIARGGDPSAPQRERGFMSLLADEVPVAIDEALFVLGHPNGKTMKLSVEARGVIGYNSNRTRLRHRVSTAPGSSGSPVFNLRGDLIALHSGRDTAPVPRFRIAVPVGAIRELMRARGKLDELSNVAQPRYEPPSGQAQGEQARDAFPNVHEKHSRKGGESMGRNVFFSFHFERDHWRVAQVRNCHALIELQPYLDWAEWEKIERQGNGAIKTWIDTNLRGASVTCVLIGSESWTRQWVIYEIEQSYSLGKGMVGIWVHDLLDQNGKMDPPGQNPFQHAKTPDGRSVESAMIAAGRPIAHYNWKAAKASLHDASGATSLAAWVEAAARAVGR